MIMDEQRQQQYLEIISDLLACPSGEESQILASTNPDFIDIDLVNFMKQVAIVCEQQGDRNTADFLTNIANQIAVALESLVAESTNQCDEISLFTVDSIEYDDFLTETLRLIVENDGDPETVYPFLSKHLDKLNQNCARELQKWARVNLSNPESKPAREIAAGIGNFSNILHDFYLGNRASNLEIALTGCEIVATFFDRQVFPVQWAGIQINLGNIYHHRIEGNRADNLEQAISCYQFALQFFTLEAFPSQCSLAQNNLGNVYLDRIDGERIQNLETAINYYKLALQVRTYESMPQDWAQTQSNLGIAYFNRHYGDRSQNIEQAIAVDREALQVLTQNNYPQEWAIITTNLATAYQERILGNKSENIEIAIILYREALLVRTREISPQGWAEIQMNLGNAYRIRINGNRTENSEMAIAFYQEAFQVYTRETFPQQWAIAQTNLGSVYQEKLDDDRSENLEKAITAYEFALQVLTYEEFPQNWATIQVNIGSVYSGRILGDRSQNIEAAIVAYQNALQVYTADIFSENFAQIQSNLGNVYGERICGKRAENLEMAIAAYKSALQVFTYEAFPQNWAFVQINLGASYYERIIGERAENLETTIAACRSALQILTHESFPEDWARAQSNLAAAYYDRSCGNRKQNLDAALVACQSVFQVYTLEIFPQDYTRSLFTLGLIYQESRQFHNAYVTFASAIECVEFQSGKIISGESVKQKLASQWAKYYWSMVEVCLELAISDPQYYARAIEYVERSKARSLVELLASIEISPKGNISESIINELKQLRRVISAKYRQLDMVVELEQLDETNHIYRHQLQQELNLLKQQLNQLVTRINEVDTKFSITQKVKPILFEDIRELLIDDQTAFIEWYITGESIFTFTVTRQSKYPQVWQSSAKEKTALLDWILEYISDYNQNKNQWQSRISEHLQRLAQILHIDDILNSLPNNCEQLILIPHLFLHLFPLHALNTKDGSCLLDRFSRGVRYAPSCQLLQLNQQQKSSDFDHLFAIQNPTEDLSYSDLEVETIRRIFQPHDDVFVKRKAKKEVIDKHQLHTAHYIHFSCHGYFNSDIPMLSSLLLSDSLVPANSTRDPSSYLSLTDGSKIDLSKCLTLGEIFELNLSQCRLVTLSACETGWIDFRILSDEYIGLPNGFLVAGSPTVVSSLWAVNDLSTAFLMIQFYRNLQTIDSVAVALNQAQLWLRDITKVELERWIEKTQLLLSPAVKMNLRRRFNKLPNEAQPFREPFYWAGFCAIGQ
jgi:CHAT domain-containing protein